MLVMIVDVGLVTGVDGADQPGRAHSTRLRPWSPVQASGCNASDRASFGPSAVFWYLFLRSTGRSPQIAPYRPRRGFGQHQPGGSAATFRSVFRHAAEGYKGSARRTASSMVVKMPSAGTGRCTTLRPALPTWERVVARQQAWGLASGRLAAGSFSQHPLHDGVDTCLVRVSVMGFSAIKKSEIGSRRSRTFAGSRTG